MKNDGIFDKPVAAEYDAVHDTRSDEIDAAVACLHGLAGDGPALEFAIGTGRIAVPLVAKGTAVSGIELSSAMVDVLRSKPHGADMPVTIGDMTTAQAKGPFSLVFLVYNTIDNLTSQDAQVACFQNAADHLAHGGRFVVETLVPPLQRLPLGETLLAFDHSAEHWGVDEFDVVTQRYASHHMHVTDKGAARQVTVPFRYAWPAELDLMAKMAGMVLESRWANWRGAEFTATSRAHISVWRKP